jgi:hypothetical protein
MIRCCSCAAPNRLSPRVPKARFVPSCCPRSSSRLDADWLVDLDVSPRRTYSFDRMQPHLFTPKLKR